jgi:hypothetical protein
MNKEEILEKSRQENKSQDLYEKEVSKHAGTGGTIAAVLACWLLAMLDLVFNKDVSGLMAIMQATLAGEFFASWIKSKRRYEIVLSVLFALVAVFCFAVHIDNLLNK